MAITPASGETAHSSFSYISIFYHELGTAPAKRGKLKRGDLLL